MPDVFADYATAAGGFAAVLAGCTDADMGRQSPCTEWKAADVVAHVVDGAGSFITAFGGTAPTVPAAAPATERFAAARTALVDTMKTPGIAEKLVPSPVGGELPAGVLFGILATDTLLHTWDLARATGQPANLDADLLERSWQNVIPMDEVLRRPGFFGPKVPVGADAPREVQALAFFGRDARA